ncbi:AMP-binding protein [Rhodococcus hoagii]|nr:AMP-binding protein [Prescottella equi]
MGHRQDRRRRYVPVDPELPPLRLAQHLDVVGFAIGRGVELPGSVVLLVDPDAPGFSTAPVTDGERLRPLRCAENPAWIVHTSGSTGQPKAVVVSHRGIAGLLSTLRTTYAATPDSRVLHVASLSFDASIQEILTAADAGATLVIADGDVVAGDPLTQLIAAEGVTHVVSSPAVLAATPSDAVPTLRMAGFRRRSAVRCPWLGGGPRTGRWSTRTDRPRPRFSRP